MAEIFFTIAEQIRQVTGTRFHLRGHRPLGGGCINRSVRLEGEGVSFFVKLNAARILPEALW